MIININASKRLSDNIEIFNKKHKKARTEAIYQSDTRWNWLPADIEALIFSFNIKENRGKAKYREFSRLLQVCHRWYQRCFEDSMLKDQHPLLLQIASKHRPHSADSIKSLLKYSKIDLLAKKAFGLKLAIECEDNGSIKDLLATTPLDNISNECRELLTEWAIRNSQVQLIEYLIKIEDTSFVIQKIIEIASEYDRLEILKMVVKFAESTGIQQIKLLPSINKASEKGHIETLNWLLEKNQVLNSSIDHDYNEALIKASQNGHVEIVKKFLIDHQTNIPKNLYKAMKKASVNNHEAVAKIIMAHASESTSDQMKAMFLGAFGSLAEIKVWLTNIKNGDLLKKYLFSMASRKGRLDIIQELLKNIEKHFFPNLDTAICLASENGYLEIIKALFHDDRAHFDAFDNYAIRKASKNGRVEVVKLLLEHPRVKPSAEKNEALREASKNGCLEVVKLLLKDSQVDPSAKSNEAIALACANGYLEVAQELLKDPRVNPAAANDYALRKASENGHTEVVELLLKDPRVDPSANHDYAIDKASENGHTEVVELLLKDPRVNPAANHDYAISKACENGHTEVAELLSKDSRVCLAAINHALHNINADSRTPWFICP